MEIQVSISKVTTYQNPTHIHSIQSEKEYVGETLHVLEI